MRVSLAPSSMPAFLSARLTDWQASRHLGRLPSRTEVKERRSLGVFLFLALLLCRQFVLRHDAHAHPKQAAKEAGKAPPPSEAESNSRPFTQSAPTDANEGRTRTSFSRLEPFPWLA